MARMAAWIFLALAWMVTGPGLALSARIKAHSPDSAISLLSGSNLIIDSAISSFNGTLNDGGATISGQNMLFSQGTLNKNNGTFQIIGTVAPSTGAVTLSGNQRLVIDREAVIPGPTVISTGNTIVGSPNFSSAVTLQDVTTTLTVELYSPVNQNIVLNNGLLYLGNDLSFADSFLLSGSGICDLGGHTIQLGAKPLTFTHTISWRNAGRVSLGADVTLSGTWVFNDVTVLSGAARTLNLASDGAIIIERGAVVVFDDLRIKGLKQSLGSLGTFNLRGLDATSSVTLRNAELVLDGDYSFTTGCLAIDRTAALSGGGHTLTFESPNDMTINAKSRLIVNPGTTLTYASVSAEKTHMVLADTTSELFLDGCTLHGTTTGFRLTTGSLFINNKVILSSDATVPAEAVELNSTTLNIDVLAAAMLDIRGIVISD